MMPQLYVLARPSFADEFARFLASEGLSWAQTGSTPAEQLIEFAGRICYMSFGTRQSPKSNREYILNLIRSGHDSVLEHVNWTFLLTGVTRAFTHQLVRHRAGMAFSQLSQQYHDETDALFVAPEGLAKFPEALKAWTEAVDASRRAYQKILSALLSDSNRSKEEMRSIRSAARSVLPNATETKIVMTGNARSIRHFLKLRGGIIGDPEMRRVSKLIYDVIALDAPSLIYDFECRTIEDGSPLILTLGSSTA
jgi:thymidylate synthase (FAD)